jgi:hypothetical protein
MIRLDWKARSPHSMASSWNRRMRAQSHAERSDNLDDGFEARIAIFCYRFVKPLPRDSGSFGNFDMPPRARATTPRA